MRLSAHPSYSPCYYYFLDSILLLRHLHLSWGDRISQIYRWVQLILYQHNVRHDASEQLSARSDSESDLLMIGCQNELTSSTGHTDSGSWLQYWCSSSCSSTFSQITLTSFSFYNDIGLNTSTSTCTKNRIAWRSIVFDTYHANTIRSSLLMWMAWLPDFSLLSLDSSILQCFLPHRTGTRSPWLRSAPTEVLHRGRQQKRVQRRA